MRLFARGHFNRPEETVKLHPRSQVLKKDELLRAATQSLKKNILQIFGPNQAFENLSQKGEAAVAEFSDAVLVEIQGIVESNTPILAMRKAIVGYLRSYIQCTTVLDDEFMAHRDAIYERINLPTTDQQEFSLMEWSYARLLFFRFLQHELFEDVSQDDWVNIYSDNYRMMVKYLYRCIVAEENGADKSGPAILMRTSKETIERLERHLAV